MHERSGGKHRPRGSSTGRQQRGHVAEVPLFGVAHRPGAVEHGEQVVLAPHHTLGLTGGAARCRAGTGRRPSGPPARSPDAGPRPRTRPRPRRARPSRGRARCRRRPRATGGSREGDPGPRRPCAVKAPWNTTASTSASRHRYDELVVHVAVVGVHRDQRGLEAREERLDVLDAVVQVLGHLGLVAQAGASRWRANPSARRPGRPRSGRRHPGDRGELWLEPGDLLPDVGEVPVGHALLPVVRR